VRDETASTGRVYSGRVELGEELARAAAAATALAAPGEDLAAVIPAEPEPGQRLYLCSFAGAHGERSWLALDAAGQPVADRARVRDAVSIAALCELAEESAGGGHLDDLRAQLVALRVTESPPGIEEAEEAALALQRAIGAPPRVATPAHLDAVGEATRRLEEALGEGPGSPFVEAMKAATTTVDALVRDVEARYKRPLS
jgi:hypothetical protein